MLNLPASFALNGPPGAEKSQSMNFDAGYLSALRRAGFAIKVDDLRNARGDHGMMLVLYISAVALLSFASFLI
jgi:hypothetical protein